MKTEIPIHVVLGNPPYSGHSENKNEWIEGLVKDYYQIDGLSLDEKNPKWLQDDYVKFIRFGQWRNDFAFLPPEEAREKYNLEKDTRDWQVALAQDDIKKSRVKQNKINTINRNSIKRILYRPFDIKYTYYTGKSRGFICMPRNDVMKNMLLGDNLGLITVRQVAEGIFNHCLITENIIESRITISNKGIGYLFPLYIYPENETTQDRKPNFSPEFMTAINSQLGYVPTAENIFYYIYAVFHSPQYRQRYSQFLKIDFPRLPLTSNNELFNQLVIKGEKLVNLHLMKNLPPTPITKSETSTTANLPLFNGEERGAIHYQGDGKNEITQVKYNTNKQQILINQNCYFSGVSPIVWEFKIGGYQVLDKWLKDRKSANIDLSDAEITHYQKIIIVVIETIKLMTEIDDIIPQFPII